MSAAILRYTCEARNDSWNDFPAHRLSSRSGAMIVRLSTDALIMECIHCKGRMVR